MAANAEPKPRSPSVLPAAIAICAGIAIAGAYWPQWPWLHWIFKPVTTLLIAAMALRLRGDQPVYRNAILVGLLLSTLGDIFLMLPRDLFVFGLGSFLLAHLAYAWALTRRARLIASPWAFVAYAAVGGGVLAILWPKLPAGLHAPVSAYVAVLATMAAQAAAVWRVLRTHATALAALGGALFVLSDATLAIDRFATPFPSASAMVLATYWMAQTLLALSIAQPSVRH